MCSFLFQFLFIFLDLPDGIFNSGYVIEFLNDALYSNSIVLDLSKAFDCIKHKILLGKLYQHGICGIPRLVIQSCLANRSQIVQVSHIVGNHWKDYLSSCLLDISNNQYTNLLKLNFIFWQPKQS
jgi:hypothetical protein